MRKAPRKGLSVLIVGFAVLAALLPLLALLPNVLEAARSESHQRAAEILRSAAQQTASRMHDALTEHWRDHTALAHLAVGSGVGTDFNLRLDTLKAVNPGLAWMGLAGANGQLLAATERAGIGSDMSARQWFRAGLQGSFTSDHSDPLLHGRATSTAENGRRITFAGPLLRPNGTVLGVLGSQIELSTLQDTIRAAPMPNGAEVLLIARDGRVLSGPATLEGQRLGLRVAMSAQQGVAASAIESWDDGQSYLTVATPVTSAGGVTNFGWSIVVRQSVTPVLGVARSLTTRLALPLLLSACVVLLAGLLLARNVAQPLRRLTQAALDLAEGRLDRPMPEFRTTWELAALADALAKLDPGLPAKVVKLRKAA